jgi:hypothetical protein
MCLLVRAYFYPCVLASFMKLRVVSPLLIESGEEKMRRTNLIALFGLVLLFSSPGVLRRRSSECKCTSRVISAAIECTTFRRP